MPHFFSACTHNTRNLDALRKKVSGLGDVVRGGKTGSQLVNNILSGCQRLGPKSEDSNHGKTAVLQLLQSLLLVLFGAVVESEWVVASLALSDTKITGHVAGTFVLDDSKTTELKEGHEEEDLQKCKSRDLVEGLKGIGVAVRIKTSPLVSGKGSEKSGSDETNNSKLGDTSMDEFGLTVPGQVIRESVASLNSLEPGSNRNG